MDVFIFFHEIRNIYEPLANPKTDPIFTLLSLSHSLSFFQQIHNHKLLFSGKKILRRQRMFGVRRKAIKGHLSNFNHSHCEMEESLK